MTGRMPTTISRAVRAMRRPCALDDWSTPSITARFERLGSWLDVEIVLLSSSLSSRRRDKSASVEYALPCVRVGLESARHGVDEMYSGRAPAKPRIVHPKAMRNATHNVR